MNASLPDFLHRAKSPLRATLLVAATTLVVGVAWALALRSLLATIAAQIITRRVAGVRHRDYARAVLPGLALGALLFLLA